MNSHCYAGDSSRNNSDFLSALAPGTSVVPGKAVRSTPCPFCSMRHPRSSVSGHHPWAWVSDQILHPATYALHVRYVWYVYVLFGTRNWLCSIFLTVISGPPSTGRCDCGVGWVFHYGRLHGLTNKPAGIYIQLTEIKIV